MFLRGKRWICSPLCGAVCFLFLFLVVVVKQTTTFLLNMGCKSHFPGWVYNWLWDVSFILNTCNSYVHYERDNFSEIPRSHFLLWLQPSFSHGILWQICLNFVFILTAPGSRIELQFWDLFEREILAYLEFNFWMSNCDLNVPVSSMVWNMLLQFLLLILSWPHIENNSQ